ERAAEWRAAELRATAGGPGGGEARRGAGAARGQEQSLSAVLRADGADQGPLHGHALVAPAQLAGMLDGLPRFPGVVLYAPPMHAGDAAGQRRVAFRLADAMGAASQPAGGRSGRVERHARAGWANCLDRTALSVSAALRRLGDSGNAHYPFTHRRFRV